MPLAYTLNLSGAQFQHDIWKLSFYSYYYFLTLLLYCYQKDLIWKHGIFPHIYGDIYIIILLFSMGLSQKESYSPWRPSPTSSWLVLLLYNLDQVQKELWKNKGQVYLNCGYSRTPTYYKSQQTNQWCTYGEHWVISWPWGYLQMWKGILDGYLFGRLYHHLVGGKEGHWMSSSAQDSSFKVSSQPN